jgi:F-type H+-transporting ATPase subunit gamma
VSRQRRQRYRLSLYRELNEIVGAMKNMAKVELHRTLHLEQNQRQAQATVAEAMALYLQATHGIGRPQQPQRRVLLALGSERGFCGGFNEQLSRALEREGEPCDELLIMGGRLAMKLDGAHRGSVFAGPTTVDEILPRLHQVVDHLVPASGPLQLTVLAHGQHGPKRTQLIPCRNLPRVTGVVHVDTTCRQQALFEEMQWQWLYQGLFRTMLLSLMRENRLRLQQMEGAQEHLTTLIDSLQLRLNTLRQQEIVEEIEMILISQNSARP